MRKMKTLFKRTFTDNHVANTENQVTPGCEWVLQGEGIATQKLDGTCCLIKDGKLFARFDYKEGRKLPDGAIPCQDKPDPVTGHFPHWVEVKDQPQYKWHKIAFENTKGSLSDGTYELVGVHFMNNPEKIESGDVLIKHGSIVLENVPRTYEGIREYLRTHEIEGIVFHRGNGDMCKIKRTDFNFEWNGKTFKQHQQKGKKTSDGAGRGFDGNLERQIDTRA